jgi:chromosome segregation ATPase
VLNGNIDADKQEIQSIENTLMLSKKNCEKEKGRNQEYRKTIKEIREQKSENEKILEQEKSELEEDIKQLKNKLISLLR